MDREQMVERVVTVMLSEYIEEDLTPRAWDYMLAEKVLDAILPQITTVEEVLALELPLGSMLVDDGGLGVLHWGHYPRQMLERHIATYGPLTVVWRP